MSETPPPRPTSQGQPNSQESPAGEPAQTPRGSEPQEAGKADRHHRQVRKVVSLSADEYERLLAQAKEAESYKDQCLWALADIENTKKRLARERAEFVQFASERVLSRLLPILESFEQALKSVEEPTALEPTLSGQPGAAASVQAGIRLIYGQLMELLAKEGLKRIEAVGKPFDHRYHEAVGQVESNGVVEQTVIEEVRAGYILHEKVLRPALVKVAKKP